MLRRKQIKDLAATGHPKETAKLILDGIKGKKEKSKSYLDNGHSISVHFIPKKGMVNIDVHEGEKVIPVVISRKEAIVQAHLLQA